MRNETVTSNLVLLFIASSLVACGHVGYDDQQQAIMLSSDSDDCRERVTVCAQSYPEQCHTYCIDGPDDCVVEEVCYETQSYPTRVVCHETCDSELVPLPECEEVVIAISSDGSELIACVTPGVVGGEPPSSGCSAWETVCVAPAIYPPVDPVCQEVCADGPGGDEATPPGDPGTSPPAGTPGSSGGSGR